MGRRRASLCTEAQRADLSQPNTLGIERVKKLVDFAKALTQRRGVAKAREETKGILPSGSLRLGAFVRGR
jgi:hypothetical protein